MYLMAQNGKNIELLKELFIFESSEGDFKVRHQANDSITTMGVYPTIEAAITQVSGVAAAIRQGTPLYRFD